MGPMRDDDTIVVDASVIAAILFEEPRADEAEQWIASNRLVAPALISLEIANVVVRQARRHSARGGQAPDASYVALVRIFQSMDIGLVDLDAVHVVATALEADLTAYDAAYLHLARLLGVDLATFDERLREVFEGGEGGTV